MPIFCVWTGGDGTQTDSTQTASALDWNKADVSLTQLVSDHATALTTSGNIIYIASDNAESTVGGNRTVTGPGAGKPVVLISADRTSPTPTYAVSTATQVNATDSTSTLTFDGCFALYGITAASAGRMVAGFDSNESFFAQNSTFKLGASQDFYLSALGRMLLLNCALDCSADSGGNSTAIILPGGSANIELVGLTLPGASNRTGVILNPNGAFILASGCDFSTASNATLCEVVQGTGTLIANNCKLTSAQAAAPYSRSQALGFVSMSNCSTADAPAYAFKADFYGRMITDTSKYITTGGASVEDVTQYSWAVTTEADCAEGIPFATQWIYGVATAGTKTLALRIAHSGAGTGTGGLLTDAEAWIEVEYMATDNSGLYALATDKRATITTTPADQTTDESSWTGSPGEDLQILSKQVTVGEAGLYRVRAAFGVASKTIYVDPKVVVT